MQEFKQIPNNVVGNKDTILTLTGTNHGLRNDQVATQFDEIGLPLIGSLNEDTATKMSEREPSPSLARQRFYVEEYKPSVFSTICEAYFKPRTFESNGTIYKALGVEYFKMALMGTVGGIFSYVRDKTGCGFHYCLSGRGVNDLEMMVVMTRLNESVHMGSILLTNLPFAITSLSNGQAPSLTNFVMFAINAYCIMLQRFNRERLCKVIDKLDEKLNLGMFKFKLPDKYSR